ncbi:MAG: hypothetical protein ABFD92_02030 [Planctomycetaceae bacterium]|nr:hypothetical protein [Planctomycetaceae bacterium]
MSYDPAIRTEAFELYLAGNSPGDIARELKRRHVGKDVPSAKTIENWAYVPKEGKTWSERRYEAEKASQDAVSTEYVSARSRVMADMLQLREKLAGRVLRMVEDAEEGSLSQEVFAMINVSKFADNALDSRLAEETRKKDAIDCLMEAIRRTVPNFEKYEPAIKIEWQRLVNAREGATAAAG